LLWNVRPDTSVYFSYTTSFLPQYGANRDREGFDPQRGVQYELGAKKNIFGQRLFATLALYRITKNNVLTVDPVDPLFRIATG
jgi:iron complex outermembrane recepter protein